MPEQPRVSQVPKMMAGQVPPFNSRAFREPTPVDGLSLSVPMSIRCALANVCW